ncbi:MAG: 7-carboxy-7-deazaguanine synthase QueE [Thiovulaceae bacterium]|nr:7-carboxy-7-deazaguanine synthase QueE [Sulfurimonadaceae bacterium]
MLYLVEHFFSIQGEGRYTGTPSLFFRFGGCNMKCEGFACTEELENGSIIKGCDTIYAVDKEHFLKNWIPIKRVDELLGVLDLYELPKCVDVVITGGEPLIYANDEIFINFLENLHKKSHRITFETNASLAVDFEKYPIYKECIFALSVKLSNSGENEKKRIKPDIINSISTNAKDVFFKFSIDADSISAGLDAEIDEISSYSHKTQIYCMPVAKDKEELEKNTLELVEYCKTKGYNFSDRLHMRIWDKEKGI